MHGSKSREKDGSIFLFPTARAGEAARKQEKIATDRKAPATPRKPLCDARETTNINNEKTSRCALRVARCAAMRYALCGYALCLQLQLMLIMRYALCCAALHFHFHALTLTLTTTRERVTSTFETRGSTVQVQYCTVRVLYLYLYYVRTVPVAAWRCFLFVIRHFWFWLLG
jgi:hypothetical protein